MEKRLKKKRRMSTTMKGVLQRSLPRDEAGFVENLFVRGNFKKGILGKKENPMGGEKNKTQIKRAALKATKGAQKENKSLDFFT